MSRPDLARRLVAEALGTFCLVFAGTGALVVNAVAGNPLGHGGVAAAFGLRDRHTTSGAKSDAGDAKLLADLVRTDHHNHRPLAGDSDQASAIRVLARAHQGLIWTRQRQVSGLRSALRDYSPGALSAFGTDLGSSDALAILAIAPTPGLARALSRAKITLVLRRAGRRRNLERRAAEIRRALSTDQPETSDAVAEAFGAAAGARVAVLVSLNQQSSWRS